MKQLILIIGLLACGTIELVAQTCPFRIEILPEQFMVGTSQLSVKSVSKIEVKFSEEVMEVLLPLQGKTYRIEVVNENCQAYCKRDKRVRQLNSGDEKLVKNLFAGKAADVERQIKTCGAL